MVERELGRGGAAIVYLAREPKHARQVALKVLRPELGLAVRTERFLREIQIAAQLSHPHILRLYDSGQAGTLLYYVTPYVEGESLRDLLRRGKRLPVEQAVEIAAEVADALSYAHGFGVIHRDIKPENILLEAGHAVVADFGLARAVVSAGEAGSGGGEGLTETGMVLGTPAYMSPEQMSAEPRLDGRSDIYALGCVLYEMLAGQPPYTGPTAQAIFAKQLSDPVPSLAARRDSVPPVLDDLVRKALAKEPGDRFATAQELGGALRQARAALSGAGVERAARPRRRRYRLAAGVGALLVGAALGYFLWVPRSAVPAVPRLVVLPFANLSTTQSDEFARAIGEEITARLASVRGLTVVSRAGANYSIGLKSLRQVSRDLHVQYALEGTTYRQPGSEPTSRLRVTARLIRLADGAYLWAAVYDTVVTEVLAVQSSVARQVVAALGVAVAESERRALEAPPTRNLDAYRAYLRGNQYYARGPLESDLRAAIEMYQRAVELDPNFATAYARLAQAHAALRWFMLDPSEERLAAAKRAADEALRLEPDRPDGHVALGYYYYWGHRDYPRAEKEFAQAESMAPANPEILAALASVYRRQGGWERAIEYRRLALEIDPEDVGASFELGNTYFVLGRYADAERAFNRAIDLAPDDPRAYTAKVWLWLGWTGDVAGARGILEAAVPKVGFERLFSQFLGWYVVDSWWISRLLGSDRGYQSMIERLDLELPGLDSAWYYLHKAALRDAQGDAFRARAYYDSSRVVWEGRLRKAPTNPYYHSLVAVSLGGSGNREAAVREGRRAVALLPLSADAFEGHELAVNLALTYAMVGERSLATELFGQVLGVPGRVSPKLIALDPGLASLREEPSFRKLLRLP